MDADFYFIFFQRSKTCTLATGSKWISCRFQIENLKMDNCIKGAVLHPFHSLWIFYFESGWMNGWIFYYGLHTWLIIHEKSPSQRPQHFEKQHIQAFVLPVGKILVSCLVGLCWRLAGLCLRAESADGRPLWHHKKIWLGDDLCFLACRTLWKDLTSKERKVWASLIFIDRHYCWKTLLWGTFCTSRDLLDVHLAGGNRSTCSSDAPSW